MTHEDPYAKPKQLVKGFINLSTIPIEKLHPAFSIHIPVDGYCEKENLYLYKSESLMQIHHFYLGSYEQFTYRTMDARRNDPNKDRRARDGNQWEKEHSLDFYLDFFRVNCK